MFEIFKQYQLRNKQFITTTYPLTAEQANAVRATALRTINLYDATLSFYNNTGRTRAKELREEIQFCKDEKLLVVLARFMKEGKTAYDRAFYRFFGTSSSIQSQSLRGRIIDAFLPPAYFAKQPADLRVVNIRQHTTQSIENIADFIKKNMNNILSAFGKFTNQEHSRNHRNK